MSSSEGQRWTIDYVKLLWRRSSPFHETGGEQSVMAMARYCQDASGGERQSWSLNVLPMGDPKDCYIVVDVWGAVADHFVRAMPSSWAYYVRRLDVRTELGAFDAVDVRNFAQAAFWQGAKGVNLALLESRPRVKNNRRDVGGIGVVYGSRKSARHMVLYKRGNEPMALEFRLQDKAANVLARHVYDQLEAEGEPPTAFYPALLSHLAGAAGGYLLKTVGTTDPAGFVEKLAGSGADVNEVREAIKANKAADANHRDFWNALAEDAPNETGAFDFVPDEERPSSIRGLYGLSNDSGLPE